MDKLKDGKKYYVPGRKLLGTMYIRLLYPSKSIWLQLCKLLLFGEQCRILGFHEWREFPMLNDAFGPELWLFNTAVDYTQSDAVYNSETNRLMIKYDIVGDYFYEGVDFYAVLLRKVWPFFEVVKDVDFTYDLDIKQ